MIFRLFLHWYTLTCALHLYSYFSSYFIVCSVGGIGRDNLPSKNAEDLDACHIYSISAQTTRAARAPQAQLQVQAASSSSSSSSAADLLESQSTSVGSPDQSAVLRCFVHERVTRYCVSSYVILYCIQSTPSDISPNLLSVRAPVAPCIIEIYHPISLCFLSLILGI